MVFHVVEWYSSTLYPPSKEVYLLVFDSNKVLRYKYFKMFVMLWLLIIWQILLFTQISTFCEKGLKFWLRTKTRLELSSANKPSRIWKIKRVNGWIIWSSYRWLCFKSSRPVLVKIKDDTYLLLQPHTITTRLRKYIDIRGLMF